MRLYDKLFFTMTQNSLFKLKIYFSHKQVYMVLTAILVSDQEIQGFPLLSCEAEFFTVLGYINAHAFLLFSYALPVLIGNQR